MGTLLSGTNLGFNTSTVIPATDINNNNEAAGPDSPFKGAESLFKVVKYLI